MKVDPFAQQAQSLALRARRNEVLAGNIANVDTPNYKARDLDFSAAMRREIGAALPMAQTQAGHIGQAGDALLTTEALAYRIPTQPSVDGNTVEADIEQAAYAENVVHYQASLTFLNSKIRGLRLAIRGGS
jgi:flagellar basal-body rod protein FlgB